MLYVMRVEKMDVTSSVPLIFITAGTGFCEDQVFSQILIGFI
jgi:hypothetical protein